jgi:hypothetical protein
MANTKIPVELSSTPGIVDGSNATAITINSSEQVGIGTTSPVATLQVKTQADGNLAFQNSTSVTGGVKLNCFNDAANASSPFEIDGSTLQFNIGATEKMRIDSSGNVGIGITPTSKLTVFGTGAGNSTVQIEGEGGADPYINFLANNTQHWSLGVDDSDSDKFKISKHSALGTNDYFTVDTSGNVFIGSTFPSGNYTDASMTPSLRLGNGVNIGIAFNRLNISTSASAVFDTSNISNDGQSASGGDGLYMFTLVRTGGSYGTRFVGILGVDDSVCAIVETLENQNFTVTTSGTVLSAAISYSGSAISCVATLQPLAIGE